MTAPTHGAPGATPVPPEDASTPPPGDGLARRLRAFDFFSVAFGSIIGVGWVVVMGSWLERAGPGGAMLAFALAGAVMYLIGLCYAELTAAMPVAGGEIAFSYRAFGLGKAALVGWFLALGYVAVSGFEAVAIGRIVAHLVPATDALPLWTVQGNPVYLPHLLLGLAVTLLLTWMNYRGIHLVARFQNALTLFLIAAALVFVGAALLRGSAANLAPAFPAAPVAGTLAVFITTPLWFVGFDIIPQAAEESLPGFPRRRLGTLILAAIASATGFYVVVILSVALLEPWTSLVERPLPTAAAFRMAFRSPLLARLVLVAGLVGLLTSWNGFFLAGARVLFGLGRARIIPAGFGEPHPRFGTPHRAVLLVGAVTALAPVLGHRNLTYLVNVSSLCIAIAFLGVCLSMRKLRRRLPGLVRPYRVRAGRAVALLGAAGAALIVAALVLPGSPVALSWPVEWLILAGWTFLGALLWRTAAPLRAAIPEAERARLILRNHGGHGTAPPGK